MIKNTQILFLLMFAHEDYNNAHDPHTLDNAYPINR